jgi:hypothetical protein
VEKEQSLGNQAASCPLSFLMYAPNFFVMHSTGMVDSLAAARALRMGTLHNVSSSAAGDTWSRSTMQSDRSGTRRRFLGGILGPGCLLPSFLFPFWPLKDFAGGFLMKGLEIIMLLPGIVHCIGDLNGDNFTIHLLADFVIL